MFIGGNLKNLRILYGYSQPSLAAETSISESDIWQYENGHKQPSFEHVNVLKKLFSVRAGYFYREDLINKQHSNIEVNYISFRFLHE